MNFYLGSSTFFQRRYGWSEVAHHLLSTEAQFDTVHLLWSVAYAEKFHGGDFIQWHLGSHLYLVCAVCDVTI